MMARFLDRLFWSGKTIRNHLFFARAICNLLRSYGQEHTCRSLRVPLQEQNPKNMKGIATMGLAMAKMLTLPNNFQFQERKKARSKMTQREGVAATDKTQE
jgi:hypothetical protein